MSALPPILLTTLGRSIVLVVSCLLLVRETVAWHLFSGAITEKTVKLVSFTLSGDDRAHGFLKHLVKDDIKLVSLRGSCSMRFLPLLDCFLLISSFPCPYLCASLLFPHFEQTSSALIRGLM